MPIHSFEPRTEIRTVKNGGYTDTSPTPKLQLIRAYLSIPIHTPHLTHTPPNSHAQFIRLNYIPKRIPNLHTFTQIINIKTRYMNLVCKFGVRVRCVVRCVIWYVVGCVVGYVVGCGALGVVCIYVPSVFFCADLRFL